MVRSKGNLDRFHETYEVWEELGRGEFGRVSRVRHKLTGMLRAVKQVQHIHLQETTWEHLQPEVEALTDLDHPNIIRLFEYYDSGEDLFLIEELCAGGTLEGRLADSPGGRLPGEEAAWLLRQMLKAVWCCHLHGLVHRDLKADNFMFGERGENHSLKLIDFGLSLPTKSQAAGQGTQSQAGALASSAPETLRGCVRHGPPADVWSLGALLFRLLTGEHLVAGLAAPGARLRRWLAGEAVEAEVVRKVCDREYIGGRIAFARANPAIPEEACDLLEAMLREDPAERISAIHALTHPFIIASYMAHPRGSAVFDAELIPKMRRFAAMPSLQRLGLLVEAHILGPHDEPLLGPDYLSFRAADVRSRGVLTAADLSEALRAHGLEVPGDLEEICRAVDISGDGVVNLVEFIAATTDKQVYRRQRLCRATFRALDADGDGRITAADLEVVLKLSPKPAKTASAVIEEVDKKRQGYIDLETFLALMKA